MELRVAYVDHTPENYESLSVRIPAHGTGNCRCKRSTTSFHAITTARTSDVSISSGSSCSIIGPPHKDRIYQLDQAVPARRSLPFGQQVAFDLRARTPTARTFKLACQVPCPPYTYGTPTDFLPACCVLRRRFFG